jgi:hypothetical protein
MLTVGCAGTNNHINDSQTANTPSQEQVSSPTPTETSQPTSTETSFNQDANNTSLDGVKLSNNDKPLNESVHLTSSSMLETLTHEDLGNYSDTIVIGTVKEILPSKWNTIDGKQPNKALTELNPNDLIYTDTTVSVDKYLKNPLLSNEVIVREIGGTVGNVNMKSDDEPSFKPGEKVLIYLSKDTNPDIKNIGSEHFIVTGFFQGKFTLTDNGKATTPYENTTLDELLSTIK